MGKLGDWLDKWELEVSDMLRDVVAPDAKNGEIVDADEVCFFGSVEALPRSMAYLQTIGTPIIEPEIYLFGIKDGDLIPPAKWRSPLMDNRLDKVYKQLSADMNTMVEMCDYLGFTRPTVVKSAVVLSTGEAFTKYEFDPLPKSPNSIMSAAYCAFEAWIINIQKVGSAYRELTAQ
ncbi:MAG: hypothetical protein LBR50_00515 [Tannerella sp.]|jgi:hypothetical protein|nr:hypothetical protein [Tannerella sp.]